MYCLNIFGSDLWQEHKESQSLSLCPSIHSLVSSLKLSILGWGYFPSGEASSPKGDTISSKGEAISLRVLILIQLILMWWFNISC